MDLPTLDLRLRADASRIATMPGVEAPQFDRLPGAVDSHCVQGDRKAESVSMHSGDGASAPDWAVKWNRLVAGFGTARSDRWKPCRFEFMPLTDTTVTGGQVRIRCDRPWCRLQACPRRRA